MSRTFSILMKSPYRLPDRESDRELAREGLANLAEGEGFLLTGDVTLTHFSYSELERLYVAVYTSDSVREPAPKYRGGYASHPGRRSGQAETMATRAHRTALHSSQVMTGAVERALTGQDPLAAVVALHLLRMPVQTNLAMARAAITVGRIFDPQPRKGPR